jgi:hypothetical protein
MTQTLSSPTPTAANRTTVTLREFSTYEEAQRLVDRLSDADFPVEHVRIVGTGLRSVEQVTGRLTTARAAAGGTFTGIWFGLLIGLLFAIFVVGPFQLGVLLSSVIFGALWGAVFGFVAHLATRGRRDFSSVHGLEAERYAVQVAADYEVEAARVAGIA